MSEEYWRAKIWGLLHDPALKALHSNQGRGGNSFWQQLPIMGEWVEREWNPEKSGKKILKHIKLADYIASASDRGAVGSVTSSVNYNDNGLEIAHLLSGEKFNLRIDQHQQLLENRTKFLQDKENNLISKIPASIQQDEKALFWWLWRCLPEAVCKQFNDDKKLLLMPAETRLPDASIFSHISLTSAFAGALAGYDLTTEEIAQNWPQNKPLSHPYLAVFTLTPIQELIKASRKMRDFWGGSWILHYLSAAVSWKLAQQYGPDCLLYPSLYGQPLIDLWLLQKYPEFSQWVTHPCNQALLTAGFPNVIMIILPKDKVAAGMQTAKNALLDSWKEIGGLVFQKLTQRHWNLTLKEDHKTWQGWLNAQWQTYWAAVPIGKEGVSLTSSEIYWEEKEDITPEDETEAQRWRDIQNQAYNLTGDKALFLEDELKFLQKAGELRRKRWNKHPVSANVGSWWDHIFDQTRLALAAVKNARNWQLPTAFGPRSTVSGLGPVVHSQSDWITEGKTQHYWQRQAGLFDGKEQLNATETVKRCLHLILPKLLQLDEQKLEINYPDLTAGVAGYLKTGTDKDINHFSLTCKAIMKKLRDDNHKVVDIVSQKWGIPWLDNHEILSVKKYHPRLLDAGWLVEDLDIENGQLAYYRGDLQAEIKKYYPSNNPTDWYILAAGDGDGMNEWLKGGKLKSYQDYISSNLDPDLEVKDSFNKFIQLRKRMGPSTHNALSRALLDFSNQLVPYLTEERYAGRLIYSGGDDVLAYTNLWEWDQWLWDIRQCFRGDHDPQKQFTNEGDYWQFQGTEKTSLSKRPLFTLGKNATISFGIVIAHHSVPLAIALENLWEAEAGAKDHYYQKDGKSIQKDAVQVRVIYGNGNILTATTKFNVFSQWQQLITIPEIEASLFEQAATIWQQHPVPKYEAIPPWVNAFCERRDQLKDPQLKEQFKNQLTLFLQDIWLTNPDKNINNEVQNWLKIAAFTLRNRNIKIQ